MLTIVLLTATITLAIITPVVAIACCKVAKELREEDKQK